MKSSNITMALSCYLDLIMINLHANHQISCYLDINLQAIFPRCRLQSAKHGKSIFVDVSLYIGG